MAVVEAVGKQSDFLTVTRQPSVAAHTAIMALEAGQRTAAGARSATAIDQLV